MMEKFSNGISAEGCGAYCEGFTSYFNFDAANGDRIETSDIFTTAGLAALNKKLTQQRIARINKELTRLKQEVKKPTQAAVTDAEQDFSADSIDMYEVCKAGLVQEGKDDLRQVRYRQMKFDKNKIIFIGGRCSNHAMRALDPLDIFENSFSLKEISLYLSAYGKEMVPLPAVKK